MTKMSTRRMIKKTKRKTKKSKKPKKVLIRKLVSARAGTPLDRCKKRTKESDLLLNSPEMPLVHCVPNKTDNLLDPAKMALFNSTLSIMVLIKGRGPCFKPTHLKDIFLLLLPRALTTFRMEKGTLDLMESQSKGPSIFLCNILNLARLNPR